MTVLALHTDPGHDDTPPIRHGPPESRSRRVNLLIGGRMGRCAQAGEVMNVTDPTTENVYHSRPEGVRP